MNMKPISRLFISSVLMLEQSYGVADYIYMPDGMNFDIAKYMETGEVLFLDANLEENHHRAIAFNKMVNEEEYLEFKSLVPEAGYQKHELCLGVEKYVYSTYKVDSFVYFIDAHLSYVNVTDKSDQYMFKQIENQLCVD